VKGRVIKKEILAALLGATPIKRLRADEQVGVFVRPPFEGEIFCWLKREIPHCALVKRY
jgi:hypothetical protein